MRPSLTICSRRITRDEAGWTPGPDGKLRKDGEGPVSPAARYAIILVQVVSPVRGLEPHTLAEILCRGQDVFRSQSTGNGFRTGHG